MAHQPTGIYLGYSPIHLMGYFKDVRAYFSSRNFLNQVRNIEQPHLQQIAAETLLAEAVNKYEDHVYEISRVMMSKDEVILKLQPENLELRQKNYELQQENLELRQKNYELQQENLEVHQKNYELQQQLSSAMNGGGTPPPVAATPTPPQEDLSSPEVNAMGYDSSDYDSYEYDSSDDDSSDDDLSDDDSTDDDSSDDDSTDDDAYEYAGPPYSSYPAYYSCPKEGSSTGSCTDATTLGYGLGFDLPYPIYP